MRLIHLIKQRIKGLKKILLPFLNEDFARNPIIGIATFEKRMHQTFLALKFLSQSVVDDDLRKLCLKKKEHCNYKRKEVEISGKLQHRSLGEFVWCDITMDVSNTPYQR